MKAIIICERDGWTWTIEAQEGCDEGVDLVYQDCSGTPAERRCLGDTSDAKALADAILQYVKFYREQFFKHSP